MTNNFWCYCNNHLCSAVKKEKENIFLIYCFSGMNTSFGNSKRAKFTMPLPLLTLTLPHPSRFPSSLFVVI